MNPVDLTACVSGRNSIAKLSTECNRLRSRVCIYWGFGVDTVVSYQVDTHGASSNESPKYSVLANMVPILVALPVFIALAFLVYFVSKACTTMRIKLQKQREEALLICRLRRYWLNLRQRHGEDRLSRMPDEWRSSILSIENGTGKQLHTQLTDISKKIEGLASKWPCCRPRGRELKKSLSKYLDDEVEPFFAQLHKMHKECLLRDPEGEAGERHTANGVVFPENTTELFKEIMLLVRDLDNLFKASYNQRFALRVTHLGLPAWNEWVANELPKLIPNPRRAIKQNTSRLFELYFQAAEVHSYYNSVFKRLAKQTKAEWYPSPLKKIFRILEKAEQLRHGDFDCTEVFDVVRGTLVYDRMDDCEGGLLMGVRALFASSQFQVVRAKDRFNNPTSACWRDFLINGRMVCIDGTVEDHIVEVQFHQKDLREERKNVGGHFIYKRTRALFEACELACGSKARELLRELHLNTEEEEEEIGPGKIQSRSLSRTYLASALGNAGAPSRDVSHYSVITCLLFRTTKCYDKTELSSD